ncbi:DUF1330 domain-containing protein [Acinetobacter gyllenbergii]|uniref:DUF1330 domain-containing protein n=1 Tax=Acinetobacter gyllenbergii TaxID=134534 RepID=UPI000806ECA2|nr:DUF1330 domain-containing protein [Acinetobacter gyllenbergii]OBY72528.1 hypothetical protein NG55_18770 [Acinetobacter gyllenbergii]
MSKKGYLFAELTINDPNIFFNEYMTKVKPILKEYDAKFLVATESPEVIEGERVVPRIIFLEFSSVEKAQEFYYSKEYQDIIDFRYRSSSAHLYILEGT